MVSCSASPTQRTDLRRALDKSHARLRMEQMNGVQVDGKTPLLITDMGAAWTNTRHHLACSQLDHGNGICPMLLDQHDI